MFCVQCCSGVLDNRSHCSGYWYCCCSAVLLGRGLLGFMGLLAVPKILAWDIYSTSAGQLVLVRGPTNLTEQLQQRSQRGTCGTTRNRSKPRTVLWLTAVVARPFSRRSSEHVQNNSRSISGISLQGLCSGSAQSKLQHEKNSCGARVRYGTVQGLEAGFCTILCVLPGSAVVLLA